MLMYRLVLSASCRLSPLALTRATGNWVICFPILQKIKQRVQLMHLFMIIQLVGDGAGIQTQFTDSQ